MGDLPLFCPAMMTRATNLFWLACRILDLLREWQIRGFKLLETRAKN